GWESSGETACATASDHPGTGCGVLSGRFGSRWRLDHAPAGKLTSLLLLLPSKRDIQRTAHPEFAICIAAVYDSAPIKRPSPVALGRCVTETVFDRVANLTQISGIDDRVIVIEHDVAAGDGLQMAIANIQFPSLELLKQTDAGDVLVVMCR